MKVQEVKGRMVARGITPEMMAKELHMDISTFYRKMKAGGNDFNVENLGVFKNTLGLNTEEAVDLLIMPDNSQNCEKGA